MRLEVVFQLSIYLLAALAGGMLAFGEEALFPSGLTVPLALVALCFCERRRRFSVGPWTSNILGLLALGLGIYEAMGERADARLLAGSHFLVYITWIVLLQSKQVRQYWWLCALSLLQVAVGSVLTLNLGWYGLWLLVYLLVALWTLSVFTLYQGAFEFGVVGGRSEVDGVSLPERPWQPAVAADRADPAAALSRSFFGDRRSTVQHAVQQDFPGRWISPRFVAGVMTLSIAGLALGLVLFLLVPRVWLGGGSRRQSDAAPGANVTGFSTEVRLGALGEILESTDRVMEVKIVDNVTREPISIDRFAARQGLSDPLFRGSVLDSYDNGRWMSRGENHQIPIGARDRSAHLVRQEYVLEMSTPEVLFAMHPFHGARLDAASHNQDELRIDGDTGVLRARVESRDRVRYFVYSDALALEQPEANARRLGQVGNAGRRPGPAFGRFQRLPEGQRLARLAELAQTLTVPERLLGDEELSTARRMALTLESHLRDSGEYAYSLSMAVEDASIDPVEDFLFNRKRGHCEYFASALALMLRSVQIPSRLVTGFKGADFKASENIYEVQQRHAHAWVEAYVDREWIVLDATPAARDEVVRDIVARAGFFKKAANSLSSFWSNYVVSLSLNRQQETLYDPLQRSVSSGWSSVRAIVERLTELMEWAKGVLSSREALFSPRGALLLTALAALLTLAMALLRWLWNRQYRRKSRLRPRGWLGRTLQWLWGLFTGAAPDPAGVVIAFYEEFLTLAASAGFSRRRNQTQREFAHEIEGALHGRLAPAGLAGFPGELAELFYRVRFGSHALQADEETEVGANLTRLRESLAVPHRNGR